MKDDPKKEKKEDEPVSTGAVTTDLPNHYCLVGETVLLTIAAVNPAGGQYSHNDYAWTAIDPRLTFEPAGPYQYTAVASEADTYGVTVLHIPSGDIDVKRIVAQNARVGLTARTA